MDIKDENNEICIFAFPMHWSNYRQLELIRKHGLINYKTPKEFDYNYIPYASKSTDNIWDDVYMDSVSLRLLVFKYKYLPDKKHNINKKFIFNNYIEGD